MLTESFNSFLASLGVLASAVDMDEEYNALRSAMQEGLNTHNLSSIPMIPSYISVANEVPIEEPVIVLTAGQDNLDIYSVCFAENAEYDLAKVHQSPMPGSLREVSRVEFYDEIAGALAPQIGDAKIVGISFAYEFEIQENLDGRILNLSKEIRAPEVIGTMFLENLQHALSKFGDFSDLHFVLLNNTVACLQAGVFYAQDKNFDSYASFILDSGLNAAYIEKSDNVLKFQDNSTLKEYMIINTEIGSYKLLNRSSVDLDIDLSTQTPGNHTFEKALVGYYQGLQVQYIIREAIETEMFFSGFFADRFSTIDELSDNIIHAFIERPYGTSALSQCCANDIDREYLYLIIDNVLERAAIYVAIVLTAIHSLTGKGKNPAKPLAFTMESKTYYSRVNNRVKLDYYRKEFINEKHGFYNRILEVEQADVIGTALTALTN